MSQSGWSLNNFDARVQEWVDANIPHDARILDAGAGAGKYSWLLRPTHPHIEALDIFPKSVLEYDLFNKYEKVHIADIREFDVSGYYLVIMGDLLEHLSVADALGVLARIRCKCLVAVPYLYIQGPLSGNDAETHLQPDLTQEVMAQRYPMLRALFTDSQMGVYLKDAT
jgi:hypothetical protein